MLATKCILCWLQSVSSVGYKVYRVLATKCILCWLRRFLPSTSSRTRLVAVRWPSAFFFISRCMPMADAEGSLRPNLKSRLACSCSFRMAAPGSAVAAVGVRPSAWHRKHGWFRAQPSFVATAVTNSSRGVEGVIVLRVPFRQVRVLTVYDVHRYEPVVDSDPPMFFQCGALKCRGGKEFSCHDGYAGVMCDQCQVRYSPT